VAAQRRRGGGRQEGQAARWHQSFAGELFTPGAGLLTLGSANQQRSAASSCSVEACLPSRRRQGSSTDRHHGSGFVR
jgi:hypothetical protein